MAVIAKVMGAYIFPMDNIRIAQKQDSILFFEFKNEIESSFRYRINKTIPDIDNQFRIYIGGAMLQDLTDEIIFSNIAEFQLLEQTIFIACANIIIDIAKPDITKLVEASLSCHRQQTLAHIEDNRIDIFEKHIILQQLIYMNFKLIISNDE